MARRKTLKQSEGTKVCVHAYVCVHVCVLCVHMYTHVCMCAHLCVCMCVSVFEFQVNLRPCL